MTAGREIGTFFVAGQIALLAWLGAGDRGLLLPCMLLVMAWIPKLQLLLSRTAHTLLLIGVAVLFLVAGLARLADGQIIRQLFELFAEYLLVVQSLELLRNRNCQSTNYLPGLGTLTLTLVVLSLDAQVNAGVLESIYVAFCIALFWMLRPDLIRLASASRPLRRKAMTLAFMLAIALGVGNLFQSELRRDLPQLRALVGQIQLAENDLQALADVRARFVQNVGLNSIANVQRANPEDLVFQVDADWAPGYMRTLSFQEFDGLRWYNPWDRRQARQPPRFVSPAATRERPFIQASRLAVLESSKLFAVAREFLASEIAASEDDQQPAAMIVYVPRGRGKQVPLPVDAADVLGQSTDRRGLQVSPHGNIVPGSLLNDQYGVVTSDRQPGPVGESYLRSLLGIPLQGAEQIQRLSDRLCRGRAGTRDKIRAVENYFHQNFQYSLSAKPEANLRGRSPLSAFLAEERDAHCEYFATASTLLLRAQGIPCRLSTGYLVFEYNDEVDYYQATNGNAHAWAEAFDRQRGKWIVVESTPGVRATIDRLATRTSDRAATAHDQSNARRGVSLWFALSAIANNLRQWLSWLFTQRYAWLIPLCGMLLMFLYRFVRQHRTGQPPRLLWREGSHIVKADRLAAKLGYRRAPAETCHQFAQRLQRSEVAELVCLSRWYVAYAISRYRDDGNHSPPPAPSLRHLRSSTTSWPQAQGET